MAIGGRKGGQRGGARAGRRRKPALPISKNGNIPTRIFIKLRSKSLEEVRMGEEREEGRTGRSTRRPCDGEGRPADAPPGSARHRPARERRRR